MISTYDLFEAFYHYCREHTIEEVIREYGGGSLYIPSYKSTHRDEAIRKAYAEGVSVRTLQRQHQLSASQIRRILRAGQPKQRGLWDEEEADDNRGDTHEKND